ncbi:MAG: glycosyltransferase family 9 protein [Alphaproteobacteria bacterium]|nr:glycosyltransferase family 9 protein [Alphaproteobacteria bacterium]
MQNKILIIKLGALGDMVQAASAFTALRKFHAKDHLTLLTTASYQEMAIKMGYFDEIRLDDRFKLFQLSKLLGFRKYLKGQSFQKIYDLQNVDRTKLYSYLAENKSEWISPSKKDCALHPQERFKRLFSFFGIPFEAQLDLKHLAEPNDFHLSAPYVLLVPGASLVHGGRKRWPEEKYAELALFLLQKGIQPVLIGGPSDNFEVIKNKVPQVIDLCSKTTFYQIIGLAQKALCAIGNDTGPTLLAASGDCKTLTFYSDCNPPNLGGARGVGHIGLYKPNLKDLHTSTVIKTLEEFLPL